MWSAPTLCGTSVQPARDDYMERAHLLLAEEDLKKDSKMDSKKDSKIDSKMNSKKDAKRDPKMNKKDDTQEDKTPSSWFRKNGTGVLFFRL